MNLNTGEERHEYSERPYSTKGPATRSLGKIKRDFFEKRRWIRNPNYVFNNGQPYTIPDPNDTRTDEELFPLFDAYIEVSTKWGRL